MERKGMNVSLFLHTSAAGGQGCAEATASQLPNSLSKLLAGFETQPHLHCDWILSCCCRNFRYVLVLLKHFPAFKIQTGKGNNQTGSQQVINKTVAKRGRCGRVCISFGFCDSTTQSGTILCVEVEAKYYKAFRQTIFSNINRIGWRESPKSELGQTLTGPPYKAN